MLKIKTKGNKAEMYLYGEIGGRGVMSNDFLEALNKLDSYRTIDIHLHTLGGSVIEGSAIYNMINYSHSAIDIYIDGLAASMGAILLPAARRVYIAENAFVMIHPPSSGAFGNAGDMEATAKTLRAMEANFIKAIGGKTNRKAAELAYLLDGKDYWFDASEAVALGIADEITGKVSELNELDKKSVEKLTGEKVFALFSASLNSNFKRNKMAKVEEKNICQKLAELLGLEATATEDEVLQAVQQITQTPTGVEEAVSRAVSLKFVDAGAADALKEMGRANAKGLGDYLAKLEAGKRAECKRNFESVLANHGHMGFSQNLINRLKGLASDPANFETIREVIEAIPKHQTLTSWLAEPRRNTPQQSRASWKLNDYRRNDPNYLRDNPDFYAQLIEQEREANKK